MIRLTLIHGDVRTIRTIQTYRSNVLISGDRNLLLQEIEEIEGTSFIHPPQYERYDHSGERCKILLPSKFPFCAIVAVHLVSRNINSRHPLRERHVFPLTRVMRYIVQEFAPRNVTFLPFSWRNPRFVAVVTLYAILYSACHVKRSLAKRHTYFENTPNSVKRYTIVSDSGVECYKEILANHGLLLKQCVEQSPDQRWLMNLSELTISSPIEREGMTKFTIDLPPKRFRK